MMIGSDQSSDVVSKPVFLRPLIPPSTRLAMMRLLHDAGLLLWDFQGNQSDGEKDAARTTHAGYSSVD